MSDELEKVDTVLDRMGTALGRLQDVAQGRVYQVGTKITFEEKFGVVTNLHQGSEDPTASTVDIRLEDGTQVEAVSVTSVALQLLRQ
jgi:hypothetical protein